MTKVSELSNTKLKLFRYLSYWLYVVCTIGIPVGLIAWQFEIFRKPGGIQLTAYGVILVLIVVFLCRGHIKRAILEMESSIMKTVIINCGKLIPWLACWFLMSFISGTSSISEKIQFVLFWTIVGNVLATFLDIWHTTLYKECKHRETR